MIAPAPAPRWIDRFGPHLSTLLGVELTVERLVDDCARSGLIHPDPADARLLAAAFDALRDSVDLLATLPPIPDADAHAELTAALAELRTAVATFMHPSRCMDTVRAALWRGDQHLLRLGDRVAPVRPWTTVGRAATRLPQ